ncbi:hypothetical protein ABVK25_005082 [Lepraria finkii]|uniref:Major facilitator superfamily (MFS) profile domain-containing protein n=1 Tax=Lepraria finkii TaxID=1340010 RepID=A0ABR4BA90_9LECA
MPDTASLGATESSPLLENLLEQVENPPPKSGGSSQNGSANDPESNLQTEDAEDPELVQGRKNVKSVLPVLGVGIFLAFLDQSIIATINGEIGSDLHALKSVSWIGTAYFLTMSASQPLYGKLSDVFGRKPCLLFAYTMFAVGSLGCGVAKSIEGLIAARAIQGIGGGGMLIVVTVLLSDFIPLRERGTYQGYLNLIGAVGSTSGGPIGGLFIQSIGWRWAFLIQVLICLIAIVAVGLLLHLPKRQSETPWRKQLPRIDFLGALLLVLAISGLLFGLDRGSNVSWRSPLTIASLCATVPLSIAFLGVETRLAVEPFTPGHVIFDKALFACYTQNFLGYAAFTALIIYLPLFFQVILEMTPVRAGASLVPAAVSAVVGTLLGGMILKRTGRFYWLAVLASTAATLGTMPLVAAPSLDGGSLASIYIGSVISFVPQGITVTASLIAIISNVSAVDQAVATACSFLFRSLGAAVGVCLVGVLIQNVLRMRLHASLEPEEADRILGGITQSLEFIKELPPSLRATVRECYSAGIQAGFAMCLALLVVATLSVFWWREKKFSR